MKNKILTSKSKRYSTPIMLPTLACIVATICLVLIFGYLIYKTNSSDGVISILAMVVISFFSITLSYVLCRKVRKPTILTGLLTAAGIIIITTLPRFFVPADMVTSFNYYKIAVILLSSLIGAYFAGSKKKIRRNY